MGETIFTRIRNLNKKYLSTDSREAREELANMMVNNATAIINALYTARGLCFSINTMEWSHFRYSEIKEDVQKLVLELDLDLGYLDKDA